MPGETQPAKRPERLTMSMTVDDQRMLIELHTLFQRRLGKRISYSTVMRAAIRKLAEVEKINTTERTLV